MGSGLGGWKARATLAAALAAITATGLLLATTRIRVEGRWRGIFLLRAAEPGRLELQDDLFLGDGQRLVAGLSFTRLRSWMGLAAPHPPEGMAHLHLEWDERAGRGFVRNDLGDGRELVTMLGRFVDDAGGRPQGLFIGGAVPEVAMDAGGQSESGMALRVRGGWIHVWCNVNEALLDEDAHYRPIPPGAFRFLGSRVLHQDDRRVVLESNHEVVTSRGRLRMDRLATFTAGQPWFELAVWLTSLGPGPLRYGYVYGDEPWVGTFGDGSGNLGWVEGAILPAEQALEPRTTRWAGIVDVKSGHANYLEWPGPDLPDEAYVSNRAGVHPKGGAPVPLASNEVFIGVQWSGRRLAPGESAAMRLRIGLADRDPATMKPRRPASAGP